MHSISLLILATAAAAFPNVTSPTPYRLHVDQKVISEIRDRVANFRPTGNTTEWTNEGPPTSAIKDLARYWLQEYKWNDVEREINQFPHFATSVRGTQLHYIHQKSGGIPLLFLHGWPSTSLEWSSVIPKLKYDIVAPDLPGFSFSPAAELNAKELAAVFDGLMKQLGYSRYGVVSTDLGWVVGNELAQFDIIGHFTDFFIVMPNATDLARAAAGQTTDEENLYMTDLNEFFTNHSAYSTVHSQKPLAISYSFSDSPVGFAAWIWDLRHGIEEGGSLKELITTTILLWLNVYGNIRSYLELTPGLASIPTTSVPVGVSEWRFGPHGRTQSPPRAWIERTMKNLTFFAQHPYGGHFPAEARPDEWIADVNAFFAALK